MDPATYPLSETPGLMTGDFDHDGNQDVAIALTTKSSTLFCDLNSDGQPELLRIVGSTLEVRIQ